MTTRGLRNPTLIQFTIDGRQGAIGARHIAEALRIPYEACDSGRLQGVVLILSERHGLSTWAILKSPALRGAAIAERTFSLDKWHHWQPTLHLREPQLCLTPKLPRDEQLPSAQQDEILTDTTPPTPVAHTSVHMPEAIHPTFSSHSGCSTNPEHCSGFYYPADGHYCAHQDQIIATQAQHTTILHQIQQHLSMQTPLGHDRSAPSKPLVPDEETIPAEQPISAEEIRAEPSHDPTTI
ncbi:hypothetical protein CK203_039459 [Vitis vinifera]|uniref:Uncharacterized protein n=1 Tax=Vitis vinifera TaxID=29760 RepID=A0A438I762_VITVI|nr:hypothetical protein CK203_039459 [Vitis vinifera]